jgi:site-specific recombinase XerD
MAVRRNINPVRFSVRRVDWNPESPWLCDFWAHGKRFRKFFASEELAWSEGAKLTASVTERGVQVLQHPDGFTVRAALRMYMAEADPQSDSHAEKLGIFERAFGSAFHGAVTHIEPIAIRKWVKSRSANGNTQAMYYRYAKMFFGYLAANRLIPHDPMTAVPAPKTKPRRDILTPAQMKALLALDLPDHVRALLLLGGFAGLRTEEVERMDWANVNTQPGQIHVPPGAMKDSGGFDQRIVDFTEPLKRRKGWLAKQKGKIIPVASETLHTHRRRACAPVLAEWPDNCLRHSFATYHLGRAKNAGLTAYQMGHTDSRMVQKVYAVPAALADWKAWWAL